MGKLEKPADVSGWENPFSPHLKQGSIAQWCGVVLVSPTFYDCAHCSFQGSRWKSWEQSLQISRGDCTGRGQKQAEPRGKQVWESCGQADGAGCGLS